MGTEWVKNWFIVTQSIFIPIIYYYLYALYIECPNISMMTVYAVSLWLFGDLIHVIAETVDGTFPYSVNFASAGDELTTGVWVGSWIFACVWWVVFICYLVNMYKLAKYWSSEKE